jgi:hypothetical protein
MLLLDDVCMYQILKKHSFANKILDEGFLVRVALANHFDGDALDEIARAVLLGFVHDSHATLKNLAGDMIGKLALDGKKRSHSADKVTGYISASQATKGISTGNSALSIWRMDRQFRACSKAIIKITAVGSTELHERDTTYRDKARNQADERSQALVLTCCKQIRLPAKARREGADTNVTRKSSVLRARYLLVRPCFRSAIELYASRPCNGT